MDYPIILKAALRRIRIGYRDFIQRRRDRRYPSYSHKDFSSAKLFSYFGGLPRTKTRLRKEQVHDLAAQYIHHRFDLLGSGWVEVRHGISARGLEGHIYPKGEDVNAETSGAWLQDYINARNLAEAKSIWRCLKASTASRSYVPIDWQLDFKSGYRWRESVWHKDVPLGHKCGVDIKVPWELSRMQHLPVLAFAYRMAMDQVRPKSDENEPDASIFFEVPEVYAGEFRHQVLDFIAANPPRFGANWKCPMDVAIRIVNWLVTWDFFRAQGVTFDPPFESLFIRSVYEHGRHIVENLEWTEMHRGNHYMANVAGLFFAAAYLPRTRETDAWLAFALQEIIAETERQFHPDGSHFEASTSYHCLAAEIVVYATALALGLPPEKIEALKGYDHHDFRGRARLKPAPMKRFPLGDNHSGCPFPSWYIERLERMAEFIVHITKPEGPIVQIGDNDSGRLLKFQPVYHRLTVAEAKSCYLNLNHFDALADDDVYWDENILDHRHLVAAINGLYGREDFTRFSGDTWIETELIQHLARHVRFPSYREAPPSLGIVNTAVGSEDVWTKYHSLLNELPPERLKQTIISVSTTDIHQGLERFAYPDFGLFIYSSHEIYIAIRCFPSRLFCAGGHAHNDHFHLELTIQDRNVIQDPGSYLYTPLPIQRNHYRSARAHYIPRWDEDEPGRLDLGLFRLKTIVASRCIYFGKQGFIGELSKGLRKMIRLIHINRDKIKICDFSTDARAKFPIKESIGKPVIEIPFSNGYGKQLRSKPSEHSHG
jgi:hypothetical protein